MFSWEKALSFRPLSGQRENDSAVLKMLSHREDFVKLLRFSGDQNIRGQFAVTGAPGVGLRSPTPHQKEPLTHLSVPCPGDLRVSMSGRRASLGCSPARLL